MDEDVGREKPMDRDEAKTEFRRLVSAHGLQWTARVPAHAWEKMNRVQAVLTTADRRAALGLRN